MSPEKKSLQHNSPEKMSPDIEERKKAMDSLRKAAELKELDQESRELGEKLEEVHGILIKENLANITAPEEGPEEQESEEEQAPTEAESTSSEGGEVSDLDAAPGEETEDKIERPEPAEPTSFKNEVEEMNKFKDFTRSEVIDMLEDGKSDEEIWESAKAAGVFFKFDGSSYYLSGGGDEDKKNIWRRRSAANNTSDGHTEDKMFGHIERELDKYRELRDAYGSLEDVITAADMLQAYDEKPSMRKMITMSQYWDEIKAADKSIDVSEDNYESDESEDDVVDEEVSKTEQSGQESIDEISVGDPVYYMEKEMRRWRDPKEIMNIKEVDNQRYAAFADDDSLYPLSKLQKSESIDTDNNDYQPGPADAAPSSEDSESAPDAAELARDVETEMPEELANIPDAQVLAEEIEKMSAEDREKIDGFLQNIGHKTEQWKAALQKKTYGFLADRLGKKDGDSTMAKWFSALNERAAVKEEEAIEARKERQNADSKAKEFIKDKWKLTANMLKGGSMFFSPHRWFMLLGYGMSAGGEAGKEVRFDNEELMEQTRYKDAEKAAEEAWAVYEQAEKLSGGDEEVTKEILQDAYTKHLPENILKRLKEYEEFESEKIDDIDKAHEEALHVQQLAQETADEEGVSTEDMQEAFEILFDDPEPGQNTAFWGKLFEKQILRVVKKAQNEFIDIDLDDSLSEEEKEQKKQDYLNKWGRSKTLQDYDRMLTEQGKIDTWAMAAHQTQRIGQGVVAGTMAATFWKGLSYLPDIFTSGDSVEVTADSPEIQPDAPEDTTVEATTESGQFTPAGTDSVDADTSLEKQLESDFETAAPESAAVDSSGLEEINFPAADSTVADSTLQEGEPLQVDTDTTTADTTATEAPDLADATDESAVAADSSEVEAEPVNPEAGPEAIGVQEIAIDQQGEGMIHAIAGKLEDEFNLPHDKAMRIGNELYIKGEQVGGVEEMYNLVGEGASFALDFGEVTADDLQSQSVDELIKGISFNQETFDAGPTNIKGLELPEQESVNTGQDSKIDNPYYGQENPIETKDVEPITIEEANKQAWEKQARDSGVLVGDDIPGQENSSLNTPAPERVDTGIDKLKATVGESGVRDQIYSDLDERINAARMNPQTLSDGMRVSDLADLHDYLKANPDQNLIDAIDAMRENDRRMLRTLDLLIESKVNEPGGVMEQVDQYISRGIGNMTLEPDTRPAESAIPESDIQQEFQDEGITIDDSTESTPNVNSVADEIEQLRGEVNHIKVDQLRALTLHMTAQAYVDSDFISVPTEQLEALEGFLDDNKTRSTAAIVERMSEESPELLTAFERVMSLDDNGDTIDRKALRPLYKMTQKLVSQLSPEDFSDGVPDYAWESMNMEDASGGSQATEMNNASNTTAPDSPPIDQGAAEIPSSDADLREAVDKVPESHLRGKIAYSTALIADNDELVAELPDTRINVLNNLLERWSSTPTSETIERIGKEDPRLLTVLERALTADNMDGESLSPNDKNVLVFTRNLVSQLTADDFAGDIPPYAQESMDASQ